MKLKQLVLEVILTICLVLMVSSLFLGRYVRIGGEHFLPLMIVFIVSAYLLFNIGDKK